MPKLNSVLADRQQSFDENEKAQARANIGAAAAADAGIKTVSTDSSLTGDGTPGSVLGVADYTGLASKDWVNQQGYITAQGAELTAGRGIRIAEHVISTPSACEMVFPIKVSDTMTVERPVTSLKEYRHKGAINAFQQTLIDGPSDTLYVFNSVPQMEGVWGLDNSGNWQQCMTGMPYHITAESVTTIASGPDSETTATLSINGLSVIGSGTDLETDQQWIANAWVNEFGIGYRDSANNVHSIDSKTDATLKGNGSKNEPLGLAEDIDHRGVMQYINAARQSNGLAITAGNTRTAVLYTSQHPMSGQYYLAWGAQGVSDGMHGNNFFVRVNVGPDWGKADSQGNYAFGGYDWYTKANQNGGANTYEQLHGCGMLYLTGQTSINISMALCSAWGVQGTPSYVNGSWAGMSDFHTGHFLRNVWMTLDKVGPFAGPRTNKYR